MHFLFPNKRHTVALDTEQAVHIQGDEKEGWQIKKTFIMYININKCFWHLMYYTMRTTISTFAFLTLIARVKWHLFISNTRVTFFEDK